jgi:glycosyltransferase involved in cell wall biosynthesis
MRSYATSIWVICPAFNEATTVGRVVCELRDCGYEVVIIDDASADVTADIAAALGANVLRHAINLGQGAALKTGIDYALAQGAERIVTFDADGQHRVGDIARLLAAIDDQQADVALGSRFLGKSRGTIPRIRTILLKAATLFTVWTTGLRLTDTHNGLRAFTRRGAAALQLRQNRMAHASEILADIARNRLCYVEVPVTVDYTEYSLRKGQRAGDFLLVLLDLFAQRLYR